MWHRISKLSALTLFAAGALQFGSALAAEAPVRIRLATLASRGTLYHQVLLEMGEKWKQAQGGGATFTVFPDGSQGGEADIVRRMRVGQLNAAMVSMVGLTQIDPSASALQQMPLIMRSWEEVDVVGEAIRPEIEQRLLAKGFVVLLWGEGGWVRFFSKERAVTPADFRKLKLFAWAGDSEQVALMKAIGYQPVALETADILPALQTGMVNAAPVMARFALAAQIDQVAPNMLDLRWAPIVGAVVVTRKVGDEMSPAGRETLRSAAVKAAADLRAQRDALDVEAVTAMKKRGLKVHPVTPEIDAEWRRLAETVYPRIRGTMVPADVFDKAQRALVDYRSGVRKAEK